MSHQIIEKYIAGTLPDVKQVDNFGYRFFLYATDDKLPFVTIATTDNEYDSISNLNREGVFRVNIGISKHSYNQLFFDSKTEWDYTALNQFMPHPDYAAQHYICVLNPEGNALTDTFKFIDEAYLIAKSRFEKKRGLQIKKI